MWTLYYTLRGTLITKNMYALTRRYDFYDRQHKTEDGYLYVDVDVDIFLVRALIDFNIWYKRVPSNRRSYRDMSKGRTSSGIPSNNNIPRRTNSYILINHRCTRYTLSSKAQVGKGKIFFVHNFNRDQNLTSPMSCFAGF